MRDHYARCSILLESLQEFSQQMPLFDSNEIAPPFLIAVTGFLTVSVHCIARAALSSASPCVGVSIERLGVPDVTVGGLESAALYPGIADSPENKQMAGFIYYDLFPFSVSKSPRARVGSNARTSLRERLVRRNWDSFTGWIIDGTRMNAVHSARIAVQSYYRVARYNVNSWRWSDIDYLDGDWNGRNSFSGRDWSDKGERWNGENVGTIGSLHFGQSIIRSVGLASSENGIENQSGEANYFQSNFRSVPRIALSFAALVIAIAGQPRPSFSRGRSDTFLGIGLVFESI